MVCLQPAQFNFKLNQERGFNEPFSFFSVNKQLKVGRFMDLQNYTREELLASIEAEIAKALNELRCLQGDAQKISGRLRFALAALHSIEDRKE
jgi:hypothetical protein